MKYKKPDSYSDAEWDMVLGYMRGRDGLPPEKKTVAYMHGYRNGEDDANGAPRERASVLMRRAMIIPGITRE